MILYEIISTATGDEKTLPFVSRWDARLFLAERGMDIRMICERISKFGDLCRDGNKIFRIGMDGTLERVGLYYPDNDLFLR